MNYAIDITRPRTKLAMLALGVQPDELVLKTFEDFAGRNISAEVQKLRFNYYTRKLKEVIRQMNSYIKEEAMRRMQTVGNSPNSPSQIFLTQTSPVEEVVDEIAEIKVKEKNKIIGSLNSANNALSNSLAIEKRLQMGKEARERVQSEVIKNRMRLKKFKEKQMENLSKIKRQQEEKSKKYMAHAFTPKKQKILSADVSFQSYSKTLSEFHESDDEIQSKISKYDEKMMRSQKNNEKYIQQKKQAASKLLEKNTNHANLNNSAELDVNRILKMVEKQKQVQARRNSFIEEQQEYRLEMRKKHEKRRSVALERIKEEEKIEMMRTQAIERRMEVSARLLKQKHDAWLKELELKNELSKLRDEEALLNAERKKRVM